MFASGVRKVKSRESGHSFRKSGSKNPPRTESRAPDINPSVDLALPAETCIAVSEIAGNRDPQYGLWPRAPVRGAGLVPQRQRADPQNQRLRGAVQSSSQPLRLGRNSRVDLRQERTTLLTYFRDTTLARLLLSVGREVQRGFGTRHQLAAETLVAGGP